MKWIKLLGLNSLIALIAVSCTVGGVYSKNDKVYRAPDGGVYRKGEVYHDRNGNIYKDGRVVVGYASPEYKNLPPGQAKKIYGDQSAKDYAPGHRKKYKKNHQGNQDEGNRKHDRKKNKSQD